MEVFLGALVRPALGCLSSLLFLLVRLPFCLNAGKESKSGSSSSSLVSDSFEDKFVVRFSLFLVLESGNSSRTSPSSFISEASAAGNSSKEKLASFCLVLESRNSSKTMTSY